MKNLKLISGNPQTKRRTWDERWKIVTDYYKNTIEQRKNMSNKDKRRWMRWLRKECYKSLDKRRIKRYRSTKALRQRIKAKWWSINHRYADNKNKKRTTVKNFIIKQASYQDLWKIRNWANKRMKTLNRKSKRTRLRNRKIRKQDTKPTDTKVVSHKNKPKLKKNTNRQLNIFDYIKPSNHKPKK